MKRVVTTKRYVKRKPRSRSRVASTKTRATFAGRNVKSPLPLSLPSKARYFEKGGTINPPAVGATAEYVYALNGLYDPNITGGGHQPIGFDQLMLIYEKYGVVSAKAEVTWTTADAALSVIVGMYLSNEAAAYSSADVQGIIEQGLCDYNIVGPIGSSSAMVVTKIDCDMTKYFQVSSRKNLLTEDVLNGNASSNPVNICYLHLFAATLSTADAAAVTYTILIDFDAVYHEPMGNLAQS